MEKESLKKETPAKKGNSLLNASLKSFDLSVMIDKMKQKYTWEKGVPNTMILLKCPYKQILLSSLHDGSMMKFLKSDESITFQIIEGEIKFQRFEESITLKKGQLLTLQKSTKYILTTTEDTVVLLTIASGETLSINANAN